MVSPVKCAQDGWRDVRGQCDTQALHKGRNRPMPLSRAVGHRFG